MVKKTTFCYPLHFQIAVIPTACRFLGICDEKMFLTSFSDFLYNKLFLHQTSYWLYSKSTCTHNHSLNYRWGNWEKITKARNKMPEVKSQKHFIHPSYRQALRAAICPRYIEHWWIFITCNTSLHINCRIALAGFTCIFHLETLPKEACRGIDPSPLYFMCFYADT